MELVEHELLQRQTWPCGDLEARRVEDPRGTSDAAGLPARAGIRQRIGSVEHVDVVVAGQSGDPAGENPVSCRRELVVTAVRADGHGGRRRSPHPELHLARCDRSGPQGPAPG
jgi:hypothetical protein